MAAQVEIPKRDVRETDRLSSKTDSDSLKSLTFRTKMLHDHYTFDEGSQTWDLNDTLGTPTPLWYPQRLSPPSDSSAGHSKEDHEALRRLEESCGGFEGESQSEDSVEKGGSENTVSWYGSQDSRFDSIQDHNSEGKLTPATSSRSQSLHVSNATVDRPHTMFEGLDGLHPAFEPSSPVAPGHPENGAGLGRLKSRPRRVKSATIIRTARARVLRVTGTCFMSDPGQYAVPDAKATRF